MIVGTCSLPASYAENWASALPKKPSQVPAWDKVRLQKRDKNKLVDGPI